MRVRRLKSLVACLASVLHDASYTIAKRAEPTPGRYPFIAGTERLFSRFLLGGPWTPAGVVQEKFCLDSRPSDPVFEHGDSRERERRRFGSIGVNSRGSKEL